MKKIIIPMLIVAILILVVVMINILSSAKYEVVSNTATPTNQQERGYSVNNNIVKIHIGPKPNSCYHLKLAGVDIDKNDNVTIRIKDKIDKRVCAEWIVYPELTIKFKFAINKVKVYYENEELFLK